MLNQPNANIFPHWLKLSFSFGVLHVPEPNYYVSKDDITIGISHHTLGAIFVCVINEGRQKSTTQSFWSFV